MTTVHLYRTVSLAEYADLLRHRRFRPAGGADGKYFWETAHAAESFGRLTAGHYHPDGYRVVGAEVPPHIASELFRWTMLDGIGPARFVPSDLLAACTALLPNS